MPLAGGKSALHPKDERVRIADGCFGILACCLPQPICAVGVPVPQVLNDCLRFFVLALAVARLDRMSSRAPSCFASQSSQTLVAVGSSGVAKPHSGHIVVASRMTTENVDCVRLRR